MIKDVTPARKKIISVVISAAVLNIFIVIFLIVPTLGDIAKAKEENYQERLNAIARERTQSEIIKLLKNKEVLAEKMQTTQQLFISEQTFLQFIQNLENEALKQNLTLTIDIEEKDEKKEKINERAISMSMEGKWEDVIAFLFQVESNQPLIKIEDVGASLQKTPGKKDEPAGQQKTRVAVTVSGKTPFLAP